MTADFGSLVVMFGDGSDSFDVGDVGVPREAAPISRHRARTAQAAYRPAAQPFRVFVPRRGPRRPIRCMFCACVPVTTCKAVPAPAVAGSTNPTHTVAPQPTGRVHLFDPCSIPRLTGLGRGRGPTMLIA